MSQETSNSKLYLLIFILSIAVVVLTAGLYANIVSSNIGGKFPEDKTLSVTGSSSQLVFPDTASINIGVITKAMTARGSRDKKWARNWSQFFLNLSTDAKAHLISQFPLP